MGHCTGSPGIVGSTPPAACRSPTAARLGGLAPARRSLPLATRNCAAPNQLRTACDSQQRAVGRRAPRPWGGGGSKCQPLARPRPLSSCTTIAGIFSPSQTRQAAPKAHLLWPVVAPPPPPPPLQPSRTQPREHGRQRCTAECVGRSLRARGRRGITAGRRVATPPALLTLACRRSAFGRLSWRRCAPSSCSQGSRKSGKGTTHAARSTARAVALLHVIIAHQRAFHPPVQAARLHPRIHSKRCWTRAPAPAAA